MDSSVKNHRVHRASGHTDSCYHEEERGSDGAGGHRVDDAAPGQRAEPRPADLI